MKNKIVYLDFDGTLVEFMWPKIGTSNLYWKPVVRRLIAAGYKIVLNTYRVNHEYPRPFEASIVWLLEQFPEYDFDFTERKKIPPPWDLSGNNSVLYIDDDAPNIPLLTVGRKRPLVHWIKLRNQLQEANII